MQGELDIWLYLRNNRRGECHDDCSDYELEGAVAEVVGIRLA